MTSVFRPADTRPRRNRLRMTLLASAVSGLCAGSATAPSFAQEDDSSVDEEVIVTGSRIQRSDFTSPNAVATLTSEDIAALGLVSVPDMLAQMTSNVASAALNTSGESSFFVGATLPDLRGLNTAWGTRTLTLVNGRRMPPTTNGGAFDLSMIPSVLVGRMETMTGGAGATYGSDAVAGVINIVLEQQLEGTRLSAGYHQSAEGDGTQYNISVANGTKVLNGRGHVTFGVEHQTIDPIINCHIARDWCARSFNYLDSASGFPPFPADPRAYDELPPIDDPQLPGGPQYQIYENVRYLHSSPYGSVHTTNNNPADPRNGEFLQFTPDGSGLMPYQTSLSGAMREYAYGGENRRVVGGEGKLLSHGALLYQGSVRNNLYTRFVYALDERTSFSAEVSYARNDGEAPRSSVGALRETNNCIYPDNPYRLALDPEAQAVLAARSPVPEVPDIFNPGGCSFDSSVVLPTPGATNIIKDWSEQITSWTKTETEVGRVLLSANGALFGRNVWTYDAYLQYGKTDRLQHLHNLRTDHRYNMALDAVFDPIQNRIVCRVNAEGLLGQMRRDQWRDYFQGAFGAFQPTAAEAQAIVDSLRQGCEPLNPFGLVASQEALEYAFDDLIEFTDTEQRMASITFSGSFWKALPAGGARMATGIDYREDTIDNGTGGDPDPVRRTDFEAQYGDPWAGGTEVADVFAELEFPLLAGKPAAEYLMVNFSGRRSRNETYRDDPIDRQKATRYSNTYKTSFVWDPVPWLRLRTTRSLDIRVPSTRELFYRQTVRGGGFGGFFQPPNPWRDPNVSYFTADTWTTIIGGNPNLRNEESTTETIGLVITPQEWARGLQFSIDYYKLHIKDGISYATGSDPANEDNLPYTVWQCYQYDNPFYCGLIEFGPPTIEEPNNPRSNILTVQTTPENTEPYWSRGLDISASYNRRLARGGFSVRLLATRSIEQSICETPIRIDADTTTCERRVNVVGQTGGLYGGGLFSNYTPTPKWSGNLFGTYRRDAWTVTAQARYTGEGKGSVFWVGPEDPKWAPDRWFTISDNTMPSWTTWNTTVSYDFSRSQLATGRFSELNVALTINNVFDKQPNFWSGGFIAGVNTRFFDGMGRTYRLTMQMSF
ncbi:MAG: TonB-dependent receptor [Gammaproteobacteria bacterium]